MLAGCVVEAVGTAATGAVVKRQDVQQGQSQNSAIQQQLQQAKQQSQQALDEATK